MLRRLIHVRTGFASGMLACLPAVALGQQPLARTTITIPLAAPAPLDEKQVKRWAQELVGRIDEVWTETKLADRDQKLTRLAENTPAELAFVTRVFHRNQPNLSAVALRSLKDVFAVLRNTQWSDRDAGYVQKIVAGWSVMIPDLIKMVGRDDTTADMRRATEAVLVDLGTFSRDARFGSPPARQAWHSQLSTLADLTRHRKPTARLAALHVLASLGTDAAPTEKAVLQALGDADRFVRWSAVQTLHAVGMDQAGMQAVARLQQDEDSDVRGAAVSALLAQPGGNEVLTLSKNALPIRRASLDQATVSKRLQPPLVAPIRLTDRMEARTPETTKTPVSIVRDLPSKLGENPVAISMPSNPAETALRNTELVRAPTQSSGPLRHVFTSSTPTQERTEPLSTMPESVLPREATPMAAPQSIPNVTPPNPPRAFLREPPAPTPLLLPPPSSVPRVATRSDIHPVSATVAPQIRIDLADLWLKKLVSGNPKDQIVALHQLAKLKQGAANCVPQMAQLLVQADVTVRREVPLALLEVGPPARIATALLERALNDSDTAVKVNAARCLVELASVK